MKITTTKKLRGVLTLPSLNMQLAYNHTTDKPQTITLDNKHCTNHDIRIASDLKLIKMTEIPRERVVDESGETAYEEPVARLMNMTKFPIVISGIKPTDNYELLPGITATLPAKLLDNPYVKACLVRQKISVQEVQTPPKQEQEPLMFDEPADNIQKEPETTPVVANPNNETTLETDRSLKKVNAPKQKENETLKSEMRVYSPTHVADEPEEEETDISFVDKEQREEKIKSHPVLSKKVKKPAKAKKAKKDENLADTETVKGKRLEGTTPIVVQRVEKKPSAKKTGTKKTSPKKTAEPNIEPTEKKVMDLD